MGAHRGPAAKPGRQDENASEMGAYDIMKVHVDSEKINNLRKEQSVLEEDPTKEKSIRSSKSDTFFF